MRTAMRWFVLGVLFASMAQAALAGTVIGKVGRTCFPTTYSPPGFNLDVYGNWIENIDRVTAPAGVTVSIVAKRNGAQNNTGPYAGKGDVTLRVGTSNASPGEKTINLINDPDLGLGGETFSFTITVLASPTVTSVDVPTPATPFNEMVVTLTGTGLQGAVDPAAGIIVVDNLVPLITLGGNASVTSVRVLSSSATSIQAKIFFSAMIQDANVALTFKSNTTCSPLGKDISPSGFTKQLRTKCTNVKNYVKSITFPTGSTIDKNSTGTINVNLLFRAPSTSLSTGISVGKTGTPSNINNARVFIKFVPDNAFRKPDGSPFPKDSEGFIIFTANAGDDVVPVAIKVVDCLGGQVGSTNSVSIQTWMQNQHTSLPPEFVQQSFLVRCTQ